MSPWRIMSHQTIDAVVERVGKADFKKLEKEIRAAYPFGERAHHPYKIWLQVVKERMYRIRCEAGSGIQKGLFA